MRLRDFTRNNRVLLSESDCSGFPYLKLRENDYSLDDTTKVYDLLCSILRKRSMTNNWSTNKNHLFNIHPVFSSGVLIPSLMGLNLAILLLDAGHIDDYENLFFDTATSWEKFTKSYGSKAFPVSSWQRVSKSDIFEDGEGVDDFGDEYAFIKSSIFLYKGSELSTTKTQPMVQTSEKLLKKYNFKNIKEIVVDELNLFKTTTNGCFGDDLKSSISYLFVLIFFWEFSLSESVFKDLVIELNLKFEFQNNESVISALFFAFNHTHSLKAEINEYILEPDEYFDFSQYDIGNESVTNQHVSEKPLAVDDLPFSGVYQPPKADVHETRSEHEKQRFDIAAVKKTFLFKTKKFYYSMGQSLDTDQVRSYLYESSQNLIHYFYCGNLTVETYNGIRTYIDLLIHNEIESFQFNNIKNKEIQLKALNNSAFRIFQKAFFAYEIKNNIRINDRIKNILDSLESPKLKESQENELFYLNSADKAKYLDNFFHGFKIEINKNVKEFIGKITHSTMLKLLGDSFNNLDQAYLKRIVEDWYFLNYIDLYVKINPSVEAVLAAIQSDLSGFIENEKMNESFIFEVKTFVRSKCDPATILDLDN